MKKISLQNEENKESIDPTNEVKLLEGLNHPNVIRYHESFIHKNCLCIVIDYAEKG